MVQSSQGKFFLPTRVSWWADGDLKSWSPRHVLDMSVTLHQLLTQCSLWHWVIVCYQLEMFITVECIVKWHYENKFRPQELHHVPIKFQDFFFVRERLSINGLTAVTDWNPEYLNKHLSILVKNIGVIIYKYPLKMNCVKMCLVEIKVHHFWVFRTSYELCVSFFNLFFLQPIKCLSVLYLLHFGYFQSPSFIYL